VELWDDELEAARATIRAETDAFVRSFPMGDFDSGSLLERAQARRKALSSLAIPSQRAVDRSIGSTSGPLRLREFRPEKIDGAMLHIHGGGWMTGEPELTDPLNEMLSDHLNLAIVSVDYRLAPENPYPAGPDDCETAALWLMEHALDEYGTDNLLIGGESAGAHLSAVTLLRLRDKHRAADRFCGANLVFGAYDLSGSPSARGVGSDAGTDVLEPEEIRFMVEQFAQGRDAAERQDPDISPLYADLRGMPPALVTVGSADHLVDDNLFFADRWRVSGNVAELLVYPDAPHGCIALPTVMSHWWPRLGDFVRRCLGAPGSTRH
jgi:acetyl esterase/lipase